jgi:uncharacterized protein YuzE
MPLAGLQDGEVRIQYFEDTGTLYVVLKDAEVRDTEDLDEKTLVEFDAQGNLVSMTIEHARERADMGALGSSG